MKKPSTTKPLRVSAPPREPICTLPAGNDRQVAQELGRLVRDAHDGLRRIVCVGLFIEEIAARLPHGDIGPWLETWAPVIGVTPRSIYHWREAVANISVACGLQNCNALQFSLPLHEALALPPAKRPKDVAKVAGKIESFIEGKTLTQLMLPLDHTTARLDISKLPPKKRQRYDELQDAALDGDKKAAALIRQIDAGTLDPGRAYAGWVGDQTRAAQGKTGRKDTDHAHNIHTALKKLATSLQHYHALEPDDQAALTKYWRTRKLGHHLPPAWTIHQ